MSEHTLPGKLGLEFKTIKAMVAIYCQKHHSSTALMSGQKTLCACYAEFILYANEKLDRCPYGQNKPTCNKCPIHCYKTAQREQARIIMRYAGPRMLLSHPILAIKHLLAEQRPVPESIPDKASNRHIRNADK
ncbi:conserved hypothetical protein [Psychromonas ingrahamii 37]|uniref:Nitrous oxide-stimulated promoter family protein n=1 Tax=Psychromonas ingrahamii (strain DSM 17664 / CCUG 51855 / 37) TaxID=357804 RepID=A1SX29_PSYIN|nr:nitrous oxide-stimulated promoter family protein [Psychromonas ingrahamii]ABM04044.1 conserved hypothetical protein [Psychromonas ingrahamii 37]